MHSSCYCCNLCPYLKTIVLQQLPCQQPSPRLPAYGCIWCQAGTLTTCYTRCRSDWQQATHTGAVIRGPGMCPLYASRLVGGKAAQDGTVASNGRACMDWMVSS